LDRAYELSDFEWAAIKPLLPNKSRGVPRVNDRRVINGIFWVLRSGAPWRDLPVCYGPRTTSPETTFTLGRFARMPKRNCCAVAPGAKQNRKDTRQIVAPRKRYVVTGI
jgi:transposase